MDKLVNIILEYESDTFDAFDLGVTPQDAHDIAAILFDRLCRIVQEGGQLRCDGDVLTELFDLVRPT